MAINDIVVEGMGFNDGQIGFLLTDGFGAFTEAVGGGGSSSDARWVAPFTITGGATWTVDAMVEPPQIVTH